MKFKLIAGPCVIENKEIVLHVAEELKSIATEFDIEYIFKASFDKANRSSINSYRGVSILEGLKILKEVKEKFDISVLTDIHESYQAKSIAEIVDVIQIPAFLCRQTDLLKACVEAIKDKPKYINVKKGQFLAPWDMEQIVLKMKKFGLDTDNGKLWLTERGSSFGYNTLVVDFRSLPKMKQYKCPIIFDATHSVQQPGGMGAKSGGQREYVAPLARAAAAVGIDGIFMETHPNPEKALSDGPNMVPLKRMKELISQILEIRNCLKKGLASSDY